MKRPKLLPVAVAVLATGLTLAGCGSSGTASSAQAGSSTSAGPATAGGSASGSGTVLPVTSNPIVNTSTDPVLKITKIAVQDNVDPATGKAIGDRLQLTLQNTGSTPLTGLEVYYEMTDKKTGQKEAYYQKLDGLQIAAGKDSTVFFDGKTGAGHYPENKFSLYRSSKNKVDVTVEVSAPGAKIATATATKDAGSGETHD